MLKWAVNGPIRQTYLPTLEKEKFQTTNNKVTGTPNSNIKKLVKRPLKRKSSSTNSNCVKVAWHGKCDSQYTSTPLSQKHPRNDDEQQHSAKRQRRDIRQTVDVDGTVKNLSNITAIKTEMIETFEENVNSLKTLPTPYASTLPTIEVEYSPSNNIIPGPILALRGIGLRDNYFEKPRYINSHKNEQESNAKLIEVNSSNTSDTLQPSTALDSYVNYEDSDESLSSSKVGDATLERMIDAILASTRKDRKLQKSMSPTYTPAYDPASDLHELWDEDQKLSNRNCQRYTNQTPLQQLRSSHQQQSRLCDSMQSNRPLILRRQRAIRRKRNISQLSLNTLTISAQKFPNNKKLIDNSSIQEMAKSKAETVTGESKKIKESKENEIDNEKLYENLNENAIDLENILHRISPDSGHNSDSECDDEEKENIPANELNKNMILTHYHSSLDLTKRRLSFSIDTF